jgi:hypothetical protein
MLLAYEDLHPAAKFEARDVTHLFLPGDCRLSRYLDRLWIGRGRFWSRDSRAASPALRERRRGKYLGYYRDCREEED